MKKVIRRSNCKKEHMNEKKIREICKYIKLLKKEALQTRKKTAVVFNVTTHPKTIEFTIYPIRYTDEFVCLPIAIKIDKNAIELSKTIDGKTDVIFVDAENKLKHCQNLFYKIKSTVKQCKVFPIKGNDFAADAAFAIIISKLGPLNKKKICVMSGGNIGSKVALKLLEVGTQIFMVNSNIKKSKKIADAINTIKPIECSKSVKAVCVDELPKNLDCVIGFSRGIPVITNKIMSLLKKGGLVLDGGGGNIQVNSINEAKKQNLQLIKLDIRIGFESNSSLIFNAKKFVSNNMGIKKMNGFDVVSGGYVGNQGDVVVDSIKNPKKILGIANGKGELIKDGINNFKITKRGIVKK